MAKSANPDSVGSGENTPDYAGALNLIQTEIHGNESDASALAQAKGQLWKKIESVHGVNKEGAKHFSSILKKPVEKRRDEFRTLYMLAREAGWLNWFDDLVDRAEGIAPPQPVASAPDLDLPSPPADDSDLAGEEEEEGQIDLNDDDLEAAVSEAEAGFTEKGEAKSFTASEEEWNKAKASSKARKAAGGGKPKLGLVHSK